MNTEPLTWGIIGAGDIAKRVFDASQSVTAGSFRYVATRDAQNVPDLQTAFPNTQIVVGYEALLELPDLDAVYVATPHPFHSEIVIAALDAGKHVLCEKPLGISSDQANAMMDAAQKSGSLLSEAYAYRFHPQLAKVAELIKGDAIGTPRIVRANFGFNMPFTPDHRLYEPALGGGAVLVLGGYPTSLCFFIENLIDERSNQKPSLSAAGRVSESGVDDVSSALLQFDSGLIGEVSCSIALDQSSDMHVIGTKGRLSITNIWSAGDAADRGSILRLERSGKDVEITAFADGASNVYTLEFNAISNDILAGCREPRFPAVQNWNSRFLAELLGTWIGQVAN
jgi:predicted dehydrogenase